MNPLSVSSRAFRVTLAVALVAIAPLSQAQTKPGIRQATQPAGPSFAARLTTPSPSGLTSGSAVASGAAIAPGATSQVAAGLPSTLPNPGGLTAGSAAAVTTPGPLTLTPADANAAAATGATGTTGIAASAVAGYGAGVAPSPMAGGVPAARATPGAGGTMYTALQIAQSFLAADANRDGELTRAEALRLTIMPYSFEEMDRNHDGVVTRFEYEDSMRS